MIDVIPIMLAVNTAYNTACVFGGTPSGNGPLNTNGWIQINLIVVLLSFTVSAAIYSLSTLFSTSFGEKMRAAAKYEAFQGLISIAIIITLMSFSAVTCQLGESMTASTATMIHMSYEDPIQFSEGYIQSLMFTKGLNLFTSIYSETVYIAVAGNGAEFLEELLEENTIGIFGISFGSQIMALLFGFSAAISSSFLPLIVVAFGVLFTVYLMLPLIESLALTVIVPLALIMRSIPFAGPKLRESSDTFLALAIGFYFIFPMAIMLNSYIMSWIYTPCQISTPISPSSGTFLCNPYSQFNAPYQLADIPVGDMFTQSSQSIGGVGFFGLNNVPFTFLSGTVAHQGGVFGAISNIVEASFGLPYVIINISVQVAQYAFEGIVLIGIDMAITLGFAQGLTKGLNSVGKITGAGPFWGNV